MLSCSIEYYIMKEVQMNLYAAEQEGGRAYDIKYGGFIKQSVGKPRED